MGYRMDHSDRAPREAGWGWLGLSLVQGGIKVARPALHVSGDNPTVRKRFPFHAALFL
jgi:hypothetical protein